MERYKVPFARKGGKWKKLQIAEVRLQKWRRFAGVRLLTLSEAKGKGREPAAKILSRASAAKDLDDKIENLHVAGSRGVTSAI